MNVRNDYGKLALDLLSIVEEARVKQTSFLNSLGLTIDDIRAMSEDDRAIIDSKYKNIAAKGSSSTCQITRGQCNEVLYHQRLSSRP